MSANQLTPAVEWRVLGELAGHSGGHALGLGPPLRQVLLALLLAHAGRPVSMSTLVEGLWGGSPPPRAVNVVHKHVGALRRIVEPDLPRRAQGRWLRSTPIGYRVDLDHAELDLARFRELVASSRTTEDVQHRRAQLIGALRLWQGPVASGLATEHRAQGVFDDVDRELAAVAVEAAEVAVPAGQADEVLPALELAARLHPDDELVHAQLVLALASIGRRSEALATYGDIRRRLVDGLGVEPGDDLQAAQIAVLRDEVSSRGLLRRLPPPAQLPVDVCTLTGRHAESDRLTDLLASPTSARSTAMATITGPPGVGKTALAVHIAHQLAPAYPDGQLFVDLRGFDPHEPARSPGEVLGVFLEALDVPASKIPGDLDRRAALYRSTLAGRSVLVVLDNARDTAQIRLLIPGGSSSAVLVTSRAQLRGLVAAGAYPLSLGHLDAASSRKLLALRLEEQRLGREPEATEDLVRLAGGLPLALTLTAARAAQSPGTSLAAIAQELGESRRMLDIFTDSTDPRTSIGSVLSWSYDRLTPPTARMFRLLGLHPSAAIVPESAAQLAGTDLTAARAALDELEDASLLRRPEPDCFRMHDLVKAYAGERVDAGDTDERDAAEDRLYTWAAAVATSAAQAMVPERPRLSDGASNPEIAFSSPDAARDWLAAESQLLVDLVTRERTRSALDRPVWRMAWALQQFLDRRGRWHQLVRTQTAGLAAAERSEHVLVTASIQASLGRALVQVGRPDEAVRTLEAALDLLRHPRTPAELAFLGETHRMLAWVLEQQDRTEEALTHAEAALAVHPADSRSPQRAYALNAVGWYEALLHRYDDALEHCSEALTLLEGTDHDFGRADVLSSLGLVHRQTGQLRAAMTCLRQSVLILRRLDARFAAADNAIELGHVLVEAGHPGAARGVWCEAYDTLHEFGHDRAQEVRRLLDGLDD